MSAAALARATAFAPASVGNVAIGFDILGFAVDALGDRVTVRRRAEPGVAIGAVRGVAVELPREPRDNTAGRALLAMQEALRLGFNEYLEKPLELNRLASTLARLIWVTQRTASEKV